MTNKAPANESMLEISVNDVAAKRLDRLVHTFTTPDFCWGYCRVTGTWISRTSIDEYFTV